jgi:hypothetical protein
MQKHPRQMRPRQFIPMILVGLVIASVVLGLISNLFWFLGGTILALYGLANLLASIITARRHGWQYLKYLPLIYAILHFSYGLGFWHGLVKFRNRWGHNA